MFNYKKKCYLYIKFMSELDKSGSYEKNKPSIKISMNGLLIISSIFLT